VKRPTRRDLRVLWDFSRPHTIIGSTLAVGTFYLVASHETGVTDPLLFFITYGAALAVNLFIVGLNQLTDVDIDTINKPDLPLPSGRLTPSRAAQIVAVSGVLALGLALAGGRYLFGTIGTVSVVGALYSLPPARLKRFPAAAALSIVLSRGVIGNFGLWLTFAVGLGGAPYVPGHLVAFVGFMVGFMTVISLLKDVPDIEGDRVAEIRTFSVRFGPERILGVSVALLAVFYCGMIALGAFGAGGLEPQTTIVVHGALLAWLLLAARRVDPALKASLSGFYMMIWNLYYLEFGAYLFSCLRA
jgi:homogentisate phytyltransferase/homogentisate geranylgeranyltransferase